MVYGADIVLIFSITKTREMLDHIFHIVTFENIIQHMAENPPPSVCLLSGLALLDVLLALSKTQWLRSLITLVAKLARSLHRNINTR